MSPTKTEEIVEKQEKKTMFTNVVNTIIAAALLGVLTTNVVMYRQQGVMQYQLEQLSKATDNMPQTYVTRVEVEANRKTRDADINALKDRITKLELKVEQ